MQVAASKVQQLLDKLTEIVNREVEKTLLYNFYRQAMNLEVAFFSAQLLGPVRIPFFKCLTLIPLAQSLIYAPCWQTSSCKLREKFLVVVLVVRSVRTFLIF